MERADFDADLAEVRARCREFADTWWTAALRRLGEVRADPLFAKFGPVDARPERPWLVMAQRQTDPSRHQTVNVLWNHGGLLRAHHEAFSALLREAGVPDPPGPDPVLGAFFFSDRKQFEEWFTVDGTLPPIVRMSRSRFSGPPSNLLLAYDTGAPVQGQEEDFTTALRMATRRLIADRWERGRAALAPGATEIGEHGFRVPAPWWLVEGLSILFAGTDCVSTRARDWRFFRPHRRMLTAFGLPEFGEPGTAWGLADVLAVRTTGDLPAPGDIDRSEKKRRAREWFETRAWALAHFLLQGKGGAHRPAYLRMIRETLEGKGDEGLFDRALSLGAGEARANALTALEVEIQAHVAQMRSKLR